MNNSTGFTRPTFDSLLEQARSAYASRIPDGDVLLRQGVLPVLPQLDAAAQNALHGHLDWAARQGMPLYAEGVWLEAWAAVWGVSRKRPTIATGFVDVTGTDASVVPLDARMRSSDGIEYAVTLATAIAGGVASVPIKSINPGIDNNALAGVQLSLSSPVIGVDSVMLVDSDAITGGTDNELDEPLRGRVLDRIQAPPHGGNGEDYKSWALGVAGVTRVWVDPGGQGVGTVVIRFMMDDTYADGIPLGDPAPTYTGDLLAVFDALDSLRPVTADMIIIAPIAVPLDVTITGLSPDTPTIRAAIEAELADMIARRGEPGVTVRQSWIWEAISIASGEDSHAVTVPNADVTHAAGEIPVMGTVSYA